LAQKFQNEYYFLFQNIKKLPFLKKYFGKLLPHFQEVLKTYFEAILSLFKKIVWTFASINVKWYLGGSVMMLH
jgi:hypothetical protein